LHIPISWAASLGIIAAVLIAIMMRQFMPKETIFIPKLLVSNVGKEIAPYIDATELMRAPFLAMCAMTHSSQAAGNPGS